MWLNEVIFVLKNIFGYYNDGYIKSEFFYGIEIEYFWESYIRNLG